MILICKFSPSSDLLALVFPRSCRITSLPSFSPFLYQTLKSSYWGDHGWKIGDADDMIARNAYESLLRFIFFPCQAHERFREKWKWDGFFHFRLGCLCCNRQVPNSKISPSKWRNEPLPFTIIRSANMKRYSHNVHTLFCVTKQNTSETLIASRLLVALKHTTPKIEMMKTKRQI